MKSFVIVNKDSEVIASGNPKEIARFMNRKSKAQIENLQLWDISDRPESKMSFEAFKRNF